MLRFVAAVFLAAVAALAADGPSSTISPESITFNKDVLPILQKNLQTCHRPGQIAPMSFLDYQSTRPWAKAMKAAVASRKMPPWFADPKYGHFSNDRALKQSQIDMIVAWADGGAKEGDPKDAPHAVAWPADGWQIKPDYIVKGPQYNVPAQGIMEWTNVVMPTGFTKDTWITSLEIKPSALQVTHHICIRFITHTPDVQYGVPVWVDKQRDDSGSELPRPKGEKQQLPGVAGVQGDDRESLAARSISPGGLEGCYVPGLQATDYRVFNAAKLIPANDGNWASPPAEILFNEDAQLVWMMPHMHLRGKDMTYRLEYPTGEQQIILNVPRYDFNWQLGYYTNIKVPKGSRMVVDAHFDNSPSNKFNPDPNRPVYYGDQTWEEMMAPFFGIVVDVKADPRKVVTVKGTPRGGA